MGSKVAVGRCLYVKGNGAGYKFANLFQKEHFNKYYLIPHDVTALLTGRNDTCAVLQKQCLPSPSSKQQHRFVLYGLGGSGKTQVALKFAQDHHER
jgi:Cdc6-like AAA superfamily ATPase